MGAQKGKDLLIKIHNGTAFVTVAGLRSRRIAFNAEIVDITHAESVDRWRELLAGAGMRRASISGRGLFKDGASDALVGTLGEVKREGTAFIAELRGLADLLSQESGRLYTAKCGADLGDGHCRVNLAGWRGTGAVAALEGASMFAASGLDAFAGEFFSAGRLTWASGGNAGLAMEVKQHRVTPGHVRLSLWHAMAEPIAAGDTFTVTAGCDKTLATCRDRCANTDNFRGFPDIPGNDFVMSYPTPGTGGG